jgi:hypothetical protein
VSARRKPSEGQISASRKRTNCQELDQPKAPLCLWNPIPVSRPVVDPSVLELADPQRSVEIVLYWLARTEHWLSPSGWLRAWVRLNLWTAVVLAVCTFTVVPAVTAVVAGLTGLTQEMSQISDHLGRSFASLLPLFGALILLGALWRLFGPRGWRAICRN